MANPETDPICQPSAGVHIVLPGYYTPGGFGLLDPSTSDGRVIFFLPLSLDAFLSILVIQMAKDDHCWNNRRPKRADVFPGS